MQKYKQIISWFDVNGLFILSAFLIVFIPLFPKIPIFDLLPGYIVRARPEDILIFLTTIIWIKDAVKHRFEFRTTYFWIVVLYAIFGIISITLGTLLTNSIPTQILHISKSSLHLFRYLEYFALFFFTYSSIKTQKQLKIIIGLLIFTVLGVVLYGFGQEYFHFPLYSTMNREYSKGVTLYLQEGARPQSTFAGHYDLAAYLVIVLPIIFSFALNTLNINFKKFRKTLKQKTNYLSFLLHITHILGAWMLLTSGSKTALFAYLAGIFIVLISNLKKLGNLKNQLKWGSVGLVIMIYLVTVFLNFFAKTTRDQLIRVMKNSLDSSHIQEDPNAKPDDLIGDGTIFKKVITIDELGNENIEWVKEQSTFSPNALKYGLSMGIRLDTLWPNALKGFANNPLFGNGYSTLSAIDTPGEYSNADSTDNNFLRSIGETGIFGFITFYGLIILIALEVFKKNTKDILENALKIGFIGSTVGILINAGYIDVFAASKVAYTYWTFAGVTLGILKPNPTKSLINILKFVNNHWPILLTIIIAFFMLHKNPFHKYSLVKDLEISPTQIESLTTAKCYLDSGKFNVCRDNGLVLKDNINIYSILLVPFLKIYNNPMMFYVLNMTLLLTCLVSIYLISLVLVKRLSKNKVKQVLVFGSLVIYVLILTALNFTLKPLSALEILVFLILIPTLLLIFTVLIHSTKFKLAYFTQIAAALVIMLLLVNLDFDKKFLNQFRNDQVSNTFLSMRTNNVHFDTYHYLNRDKDYMVISAMNPYYVDLFGNHNYDVVPFSSEQYYFDNAEKVYANISSKEDLASQYNRLVNDTNLYVSKFGVSENDILKQNYEQLKKSFYLEYVAIGCDDNCSLLSVSPYKDSISQNPYIVNNKEVSLSQLSNQYSFTVISNRFEPRSASDTNKSYATSQFASNLNRLIKPNNNFTVVTGDLTHDSAELSKLSFNSIFSKTPIIYNAGNRDLVKIKPFDSRDFSFFTQSELFIFLNTDEQSKADLQQQAFVYNALLRIENNPEIKNIFIISHNLDWQNRENEDNFIFSLEKKLSEYPNLNKFIITSYHTNSTIKEDIKSELTAKHITDETTKTHYLSSYVRDWSNDTFFEFTVNPDDSVRVNYRIKGENF